MKIISAASSAAAALVAAAGFTVVPAQSTAPAVTQASASTQQPSQEQRSNQAAASLQAILDYARSVRRYPELRVHAEGWSVARDRRMAKKRKSVARNRRAHRG